MEETLPSLITDLALILIIAGVVAVVFKRLRQPLVLGYIVAGFFASPHMPYTPSISDKDTIEVWSSIGVIFLMFSLGIEFSFKKILKSGVAPFLSAGFIMVCMMLLGLCTGKYMGIGEGASVFLGAMICMSSTTIIYKAYADMGLSSKRFAGRVLSVLVVEDILGILLMVLLPTFAAGEQTGGFSLILSQISMLLFFLLLWFLLGIWFIPTFLRLNRTYINNELLMVVSVGLCFLMVVLANKVGFSAPFGAFVMGSILAETLEAEKIESSIAGIKNLFGAVFFVSVGMMVEPHQVFTHLHLIGILVALILVGQMVFGSIGYLLSGSTLSSALQSGFSMIQIGEFSFIIATMGVKLGVLPDYIYPVIVSTSIITTFLTPYCIRIALSFRFTTKKKNKEVVKDDKEKKVNTLSAAWKWLLTEYAIQTLSYGTLCIFIIRIFLASLLFVFRRIFSYWTGNVICLVLLLLIISLFVRPIVMRKNNSQEAQFIRSKGGLQNILFQVTLWLRFLLAASIVYYVITTLLPFEAIFDNIGMKFMPYLTLPLHILLSLFVLYSMIRSNWMKTLSMKIERIFLYNLRQREEYLNENDENPTYGRRLKGSDLHLTKLTLPPTTQWGGKTLSQLHIGGKNAVNVAAIIRDGMRVNIPGGSTMLFPNDTLEIVGDDNSIESLCKRMELEVNASSTSSSDIIQLQRIEVKPNSAMEGMFIHHSGIRDRYRCMVVGFEAKDGTLSVASADHRIKVGDVMWVVGEHNNLVTLKKILNDG